MQNEILVSFKVMPQGVSELRRMRKHLGWESRFYQFLGCQGICLLIVLLCGANGHVLSSNFGNGVVSMEANVWLGACIGWLLLQGISKMDRALVFCHRLSMFLLPLAESPNSVEAAPAALQNWQAAAGRQQK